MCCHHEITYTICGHSFSETIRCSTYISHSRLLRFFSRHTWPQTIGIYPLCPITFTSNSWSTKCSTCTTRDATRRCCPSLRPCGTADEEQDDEACWEDTLDTGISRDTPQMQQINQPGRVRGSSSLTRVSSLPPALSLDQLDQHNDFESVSPHTKTIKREYESELESMRIRIANDYARLLKIDPIRGGGLDMFGSVGRGSRGMIGRDDRVAGIDSAMYGATKGRRGAIDYGRVNGSDLI